MKKILTAVLLVLVMCVSALAGCTLVKGLEKDVQIVVEVNGEYRGLYTVNAFNNAIVPLPEEKDNPDPKNLMFYGWTPEADWQEKGAANVHLSANKSVVRYDDVKDFVGDSAKVTIYAVYGEIPVYDLVVAWYNKPATSGLDESVIGGFKDNLYAYLTSKSYTPAEMEIDIRSYAGNVGPTCEAIKNDNNVDIMLGWKDMTNLRDTGGMKPGVDFLYNYGNIWVKPDFKEGRYAAKLNEKDLTNLVYDWILEEYAGEGGATVDYDYTKDESLTPAPEPEEPTPAPELGEYDKKLVVGGYIVDSTTGLTETMMKNFEAKIKEYLTAENLTDVELVIRLYANDAEGNKLTVAKVGEMVNAAADVDILIGMGGNITSTGKIATVKLESYTIATKSRKLAQLNEDSLAAKVFAWMLATDEVKAIFA